VRNQSAAQGEKMPTHRVLGSGPGLVVLLHGWPQTGACWRHVIEPLSRHHTVVVPDLYRPARPGHDKRSTASELSSLIHRLGHESAIVIGHDRGARVAHRWALDRPSEIDALVLLDILPTRVVMRSFDRDSASAMWHWFFHRNAELAERLISGDVEAYLGHFFERVLESGAVDAGTFAQYVAAYRDPAYLRASLEDYRAGFTADLALDDADHDRGVRLLPPLLVLWGAEGGLAGSDVVRIWQEHHADPAVVSGHAVPGGHYVPEEAPDEVVRAIESFLAGQTEVRPPSTRISTPVT
jgi:haloacetate dehalogenase